MLIPYIEGGLLFLRSENDELVYFTLNHIDPRVVLGLLFRLPLGLLLDAQLGLDLIEYACSLDIDGLDVLLVECVDGDIYLVEAGLVLEVIHDFLSATGLVTNCGNELLVVEVTSKFLLYFLAAT